MKGHKYQRQGKAKHSRKIENIHIKSLNAFLFFFFILMLEYKKTKLIM